MMILVLAALVGLAQDPDRSKEQERPKVPKDSIELVLTGCLKGRILAVSAIRQPDAQSGPDIRARSFRLAGKKDVTKEIDKEDKHLVEVAGLVRRSALSEPGMRVGKGVVISGGRPVAGSANGAPPPSDLLPVMDVYSIRLRSTSCSGN